MRVSPPFNLKTIERLGFCSAQCDKIATSRTPQLLLYGITLAIPQALPWQFRMLRREQEMQSPG